MTLPCSSRSSASGAFKVHWGLPSLLLVQT
jgi:hypothetical protein